MTKFTDILKEKAEQAGSILCMGIDPVAEKIPIKESPGKAITRFYLDILDAMEGEDVNIPIVKPNIAFFEQYDFEGLLSLKKIIKEYKAKNIDVLLDAKRGDIGKTAAAYAASVFKVWKADAVTVHPYLGYDSIQPFLDYKNKGVYVLNRTSNKTAVEVQDMKVGSTPVYRKVSELILKWHRPGLGAVVGATYPKELEEISKLNVNSGKQVPFLIPGVGAQGGSSEEVVKILKKTNNPLWLHRVNSSSGISY
ncbi:orotidine-5'-phosphate decarboxylase, partial [Candidatus Woesearchaeota archaeon]|nr:orotidine-5'-phosphate decarboxylase [Candidatus Woesearchaeota archaeon]